MQTLTVSLVVILACILTACADEDGEKRVMIALVIENEMDRHVLSCQIDFTPESKLHHFGNIIASGGKRSNLGLPVTAQPTAMELTLYIAKQVGINPMEVDGDTEREKVVRAVQLFEPKRNRVNYPEYHLVTRPDGSVEQVHGNFRTCTNCGGRAISLSHGKQDRHRLRM